MDIANVQEPKTYVVPKDIDEWEMQKVVEQPSYIERQVPISTAWEKKTGAQNQAYSSDISNIKGEKKKLLHASRGWNEAIAETSPEAREEMRRASPYYAVKSAMENREAVGGSNPVVGLKDIMMATGAGLGTGGVGFLPALGISALSRSPQGAQLVYNIGKTAPQATAPLLIMQRNIPEYME